MKKSKSVFKDVLPALKRILAVIYDFDGVLNDSFREGLRRIKMLCAIHDVQFGPQERSKLLAAWGMPGLELLIQSLGITKELGVAMYEEWERIDVRDPVPLIPGAKDALYWCRTNGIANALLTTRNKKNIDDIFMRLDLHREFEIMSTRQDVAYRKPDPRAFDFVMDALKERGIDKKECIFIGDTATDLEAGQCAGIETLITQTGPFALKQAGILKVKLENIIISVDNLPEWIAEHHDGALTEYK